MPDMATPHPRKTFPLRHQRGIADLFSAGHPAVAGRFDQAIDNDVAAAARRRIIGRDFCRLQTSLERCGRSVDELRLKTADDTSVRQAQIIESVSLPNSFRFDNSIASQATRLAVEPVGSEGMQGLRTVTPDEPDGRHCIFVFPDNDTSGVLPAFASHVASVMNAAKIENASVIAAGQGLRPDSAPRPGGRRLSGHGRAPRHSRHSCNPEPAPTERAHRDRQGRPLRPVRDSRRHDPPGARGLTGNRGCRSEAGAFLSEYADVPGSEPDVVAGRDPLPAEHVMAGHGCGDGGGRPGPVVQETQPPGSSCPTWSGRTSTPSRSGPGRTISLSRSRRWAEASHKAPY